MRKKIHITFSILLIVTLFAFSAVDALAIQSLQTPLAGSAIPQFVQELPTLSLNTQSIPKINTVMGNQPLTIRMCEFDANVLPPGTPLAVGAAGTTRVWGYIVGNACPTTPQDTYTGPVIVNEREHFDTCNMLIGTCINHPATACTTDADCRIPTSITFINELGSASTTQVLAYKYSTDQTLHWADPLNMEMNDCNMTGGIPAYLSPCAANYDGPIPAAVHLHGGEVPPELDGGPDSWFTSDGLWQGHAYYSFPGAPSNGTIYKYPNTQEASPIWFHDHVLGATRLNVYAGLAGGYIIYDPSLNLPANLHPLTEVVPVVIQDRMFDTNGQLFIPADTAANFLWTPNPEHPYWVPEFVGDTIVVNGKAWPYLNVQPKRYRFLFLNGSNARTYEIFLTDPVSKINGPPMWVIGTDGGYLDNPVKIDPNAPTNNHLIIQPGERYEVIIDFNDPTWLALFNKKTGPFSGKLVLNNIGRTPYPKGAPPVGNTVGNIMQFRVAPGSVSDTSYNPVTDGALRTGTQTIKRLVNPVTGTLAVTAQKTRQLTLNEVMGMPITTQNPVTGALTAYPGGPLEILVNNTKWSGDSLRTYGDFTPKPVTGGLPSHTVTTLYSELPQEGDTEVWEIVNLTADAHPIHLHLVQFQLINRQTFNVTGYTAAYNAAFLAVTGDPVCIGGVFCPGFGPPNDYRAANNQLSGGKDGGNPDIGATKMVKGKLQPLYLQGPIMPPAPNEAGWKDTVITYPGQVTRLAVRWAPTDLLTTSPASALYYPFDPSDLNGHGYVWHCHIIDHEDNEMMRPDAVTLNPDPGVPQPAQRPLVVGIDY